MLWKTERQTGTGFRPVSEIVHPSAWIQSDGQGADRSTRIRGERKG